MNANIEELLNLPLITDAMRKQKEDIEASDLGARRNALQKLSEAEQEELGCRAENEQALSRLREARAVFDGAVLDARKAEGRLNDVLRRRHCLEVEIRRNGEANLNAAKIELHSRLQYLAGQKLVYDSIKPELAPGGLYTLPLKKGVIEMREKLRQEVEEISRAISDLDDLTRAECSPSELAGRVEKVLRPFRVEENNRA